jgi:hypothetical protein
VPPGQALGLLRARRERPSDRGAAEKGDEIPGRLCIDWFAEMLICGRNAHTALPIAIIAIKIEKTDEKISSRVANILSWIAAALLGAASAVVLALLVWNGFLYPEYLRRPPLARPFSHGSFAPVGDDDDWTFIPQFGENAAVSFGSSGASATRYGRIEDVHILPIVVAECEGGVLVLRKRTLPKGREQR